MSTKIKLRRDTAAFWTSHNPILDLAEPGYETDSGKLKIGDGVTAWTSLAYANFHIANFDTFNTIAATTSYTRTALSGATIKLFMYGERRIFEGTDFTLSGTTLTLSGFDVEAVPCLIIFT
jgi:BRCT domain type II-containing protein